MRPLLIAHRGDTQKYSENTTEAFQSAFEQGADGIEFDVQCSQHGVISITHDYTHDPGLPYPLLQDILTEFASCGRLEIEIKAFEASCVKQVATVIHNHNPQDFELTTSELPLLPTIRDSFPEANIGMILKSSIFEPWMPQEHIERIILGYLRLSDANVIHLELSRYTRSLVDKLHGDGYTTHTHVSKPDPDDIQKIIDLSIQQCSFDDFEILRIMAELLE